MSQALWEQLSKAEKQRDELLDSNKRLCSTLRNYTVALARRQDGISTDDEEIGSAIQDCVLALKIAEDIIAKVQP